MIHLTYHPGPPGPLPTVVAIHGHGASGSDLLGLGPYLASGRVLLICPQGEFELQPGWPSFTWFESAPPARRTPQEFERVASRVSDFIRAAVPRYDGDPERTVVLGFSQGGTLAYRLGLADPARFRGVAALSTSLPDEAEAAANRASVASLPLLVQHGADDPTIAVERARESRDRLNALGARPDYREYPMGHEIRPDSLRDLNDWLERVLELSPPIGERAAGFMP